MSLQDLEARVTRLEIIVAELQKQVEKLTVDEKTRRRKNQGAFADNSDFGEAERSGRESDESQRPKDDEDDD